MDFALSNFFLLRIFLALFFFWACFSAGLMVDSKPGGNRGSGREEDEFDDELGLMRGPNLFDVGMGIFFLWLGAWVMAVELS